MSDFGRILGITFLGPMTSGETITVLWTGASGTIATALETAKPTRTTNFEITIGTDAITQATNAYTAYSTDFAANFDFTGNSGTNTFYLKSMNTTNPVSGFSTSSNVVFNYLGTITNVDPTNFCTYFTLNPSYTGSGVAIETSTDGGITWTYSVGSTTSPRCGSSPVLVTTLVRLRGLNSFSGQTSNVFQVFPSFPDVQDIRVRSPYMLISSASTATTFTNASYVIKQYEDDISSFATQPISYIKTKDKIVSSQNNIWINISNLVREDLEADITYFKDNDYTVARNLSLNESKWVHIDTTLNYLASAVTSGDTFYFAVDGYIEPTETQGLPNILMTGDKRYIYKGTNERIYFKTEDLTGATYVTSTSPTPTTITYSGDETYNYGYVKSVKVDNDGFTADWVKYSFSYASASTQDVTVYFYDECKYDNYDLVFKNKYGMMESFSMSKKSSKVLNVNSTDYLRSIVNYEGDFNIDRHTAKQFNVTGNEEWTLNTDFLPEYMNAPIKEAMLTEEMWLIDNAGTIIPIVKVDSNISFKTSLNDKMIQYTLKVRLSHNTIKNII